MTSTSTAPTEMPSKHCVLCHNPNTTDVRRRPTEAGLPETVNFKEMIHKIHTGEELGEEYIVYGFGNRPHNFGEIVFPGDRRDCQACHIDGTQQLPLQGGPASDDGAPRAHQSDAAGHGGMSVLSPRPLGGGSRGPEYLTELW